MEIEFNNILVDIMPIGLVVILLLLFIEFRRKRSIPHIFCLIVFSIYILFAMKEVFFPININGTYADTMRKVPLISHINLIPFYLGQTQAFNDRDILDFINNILLTIPFGFGVVFVSQFKLKDFIWLPFVVGFGVEITQLVISLLLGYPYRVIDINDALLNAIGVLIGYGLFRVFAWLFILMTRNLQIKSMEWFVFIHDVITRV